MNKLPLTLAIDTSCDETSASVVEGLTVLSNVLPSQTELHAKFGGVVPSVARLAHQERIDGVIETALKKAHKKIEDMDFIAVTIGPGLAIALEIGINKAKELATQYNKPLITVNHMEGHLLSAFAERKSSSLEKGLQPLAETSYPVLGLLVSGKHTELVFVKSLGNYEIIGETLDDACGEAFDKCGRLLGLGYPAGPTVAEFAKRNRKGFIFKQFNKNQSTIISATNKITGSIYELPVSMANSGDLNFSYSGLKTAFRQLVDSTLAASNSTALSKEQIQDLSVIFEVAAFRPIELKLQKAIIKYQPKAIWLGGGVVANSYLRTLIRRITRKYSLEFHAPTNKKLTTDNAAMIGVAANMRVMSLGFGVKSLEWDTLEDKNIFTKDFEKIDRDPGLTF